jgi:DNA-binding SARP family transcriptional activator
LSRQLRFYTFGRFQISDGASDFTEATNNKGKAWSVLKYLIAYYGKPVPVARLAEAIWTGKATGDPSRILCNTIYRLRKALIAYGGDQQYILHSHGSYLWNPEIDCWVDFLEFDKLLGQARDAKNSYEERIALYNAALDIYAGPFLRDSFVETWMLTLTDYYRRLFLQATDELADLYEEESAFDDVVLLYDKAIAIEPFEEPLYVRQILTLVNNGEYEHARLQYRLFEKILMREFGTKPSKNLERLYFDIDKASMNQTSSLEEITQLLEEGNKKKGAFFCGPETFRQIYIFDKRSEERVNYLVFLALITFKLRPGVDESQKESELKHAMRELRKTLLRSLRNGDVIAQHSNCQYIIMLTVMNDNGGLIALRRMKYLFENKYGKNLGTFEFYLTPVGKKGIDCDPNYDPDKRNQQESETPVDPSHYEEIK